MIRFVVISRYREEGQGDSAKKECGKGAVGMMGGENSELGPRSGCKMQRMGPECLVSQRDDRPKGILSTLNWPRPSRSILLPVSLIARPFQHGGPSSHTL